MRWLLSSSRSATLGRYKIVDGLKTSSRNDLLLVRVNFLFLLIFVLFLLDNSGNKGFKYLTVVQKYNTTTKR